MLIPRGGIGGPDPPMENHKLLYVCLEIIVWTPLKKQLDPRGLIASRGSSIWPSVKYVDG